MSDSKDRIKNLTALVEARRATDFYLTAVLPRHKTLWVSVAKVANITTLHALRVLDGRPWTDEQKAQTQQSTGLPFGNPWEGNRCTNLGDLPTSEIVEIISSPAWFRFAFVRNPYDRLFSAYKSKIGNARAEAYYKGVQDEIREMFKYPVPSERGVGTVAFRDFVRFLTAGERRLDPHWCSQTQRLMLDMVDYEFIGRYETFAHDIDAVLDRLEATDDVKELASLKHGRTYKIPLAAAYDEELASEVYSLFHSDFEEFGYERDSWMFVGDD